MTIENTFKDKINWKSFNMLLDLVTPFEDGGNEITLDICIVDDKNVINCICYYTSDEGFNWSDNNGMLYAHYLNLLDTKTNNIIFGVESESPEINSKIKQKILSTGKIDFVEEFSKRIISYYKDK